MDRIMKIIVMLLITCMVFIFYDTYMLGTFYFYFLIVFLAYDIIVEKSIKLIHVWCSAFIFVILSEVFISIGENADSGLLDALKFLISANNTVLIGYLTNNRKESSQTVKKTLYSGSRLGTFFIILITVVYIGMTFSSALTSFSIGRQAGSEGEDFVVSSVISAIGFLLPAVVVFYFWHVKKTTLLVPILFSLPVFTILFMGGSRFPLLFSFLGFFITYQSLAKKQLSVKNLILMFSAIFALLLASIAMKEFRSGEVNNNYVKEQSVYTDLPTYFSQFMSNEGVIDMTSLIIQHFSVHNHLYGSSSSFITYFWIPREFWPEKPTMLGHWFIRLYRGGFSEGHSASFGFTGDLFADFGYYSLFIVFLIGRAIKSAENFQGKALASDSYSVILGGMLYPYIFFFVRSPITATMMFLGILFFFYLFKKILFDNLVTKV